MASNYSFNLKQSPIASSLLLASWFPVNFLNPLKKLVYWAFWIVFGFAVYGKLEHAYPSSTLQTLFSASLLLFAVFLKLFTTQLFFEWLKDVKPLPTSTNLANFLTFETGLICKKALQFGRKKKFQEPTSTILLYMLIKHARDIDFVLGRLLIRKKDLLKEVQAKIKQGNGDSISFFEVLEHALSLAKAQGYEHIHTGDLLASLSEKDHLLKDIFARAQISPKDVQNVSAWLESIEHELEEEKKFWLLKNLRKKGTLAKNWTAGYTVTLDAFSNDITETVKQRGFPRLIGHQQELSAIERSLAQGRLNNVLLIGEPGSGTKSIMYEIATKCLLGETLPEINYKRVLQIDLSSLLARVTQPSQREQTISRIFSEVVSAGNVILVIDELHNFLGSSDVEKPGMIDLTGILGPFLQDPDFPIIALTTFSGLHRTIEQNPSILSQLTKVEVSEISEDDTLIVLEQKIPQYEYAHKKFISYPALKSILSLSQKYVQAVPLPKKALDLLEECMTFLDQADEKVLLPSHVARVLEQKIQIPVGEVETKEKEVLLNLEDLIHQRIINQEEAVSEIASAMRRARTQIASRSGPMGGFLFLGPTGVGKTETAKALASVYFGSEQRMIRLDMSEFQNVEDTERLLGSANGDGLLTTPIRENPFCLLLLDEIEKAHPNILNLFLQVLDEGHITDGLGRKINFQHTIIIATSNAGYQLILESIKANTDFATLKEKMRDHLFSQGLFRPEFLNRFDSIVIFKPLTKEHLLQIAELMLRKLQKGLKQKGIEFVITQELKEVLAELGYDPVFGARPMKRVIQQKVEDLLATAILKGELKPGDKVEITKNFELYHI